MQIEITPTDILILEKWLTIDTYRKENNMRPFTLDLRRTTYGPEITGWPEGFQPEVIHSPTGFEWGYGGSGPADLAYNVLLATTGNREFAKTHYQDLKDRLIATLPRKGGKLYEWQIADFCRAKRFDNQ